MKKIFFCSLFCLTVTLLKAQKPPVRTSDPVPAHPRVAATLPLKSGGAAVTGNAAQVQSAPRPAFERTNAGSTRPLLPSELPAKKGALPKQ